MLAENLWPYTISKYYYSRTITSCCNFVRQQKLRQHYFHIYCRLFPHLAMFLFAGYFPRCSCWKMYCFRFLLRVRELVYHYKTFYRSPMYLDLQFHHSPFLLAVPVSIEPIDMNQRYCLIFRYLLYI